MKKQCKAWGVYFSNRLGWTDGQMMIYRYRYLAEQATIVGQVRPVIITEAPKRRRK